MKRLYISIIMLVTVFACGMGSVVYIRNANERIQYLGGLIRSEAIRGGDCTDEVADLCRCWEDHCRIMAFIENSGNVAAISAEVSRLPALAESRSPDLIQQVDAVCAQCSLAAQRQYPHWRSVL